MTGRMRRHYSLTGIPRNPREKRVVGQFEDERPHKEGVTPAKAGPISNPLRWLSVWEMDARLRWGDAPLFG